MLFLSIYFSGAYIAFLLLALLCDSELFREYMTKWISLFNSNDDMHPYSYFLPGGMIISFFSWIGVLGIIALTIDFIFWQMNNKD